MTVSSIIPVNNYAGNSSNTQFDFDFLIEDEKELVVNHIDKNGIITVLTLGVDYSINEIGNQQGSFITFPLENSTYGVLKQDEKLSLVLSLTVKQESEFRNSSYFNFTILEWTFDYIVRILQIFQRQLERCIKVNECSDETPDSLLNELNEAKRIAVSSAESASSSAQSAGANKTYIDNEISKFDTAYEECFQNILDTGILTRADVNLSNLSTTGEKHFLNKNQVSNCILEYQKNITIEANANVTNGYILKSGSKVTMPDGSIVTINSDVSFTLAEKNITLLYNKTTGIVGGYGVSACYYSESEPSSPPTNSFWWNTITNKIQRYVGGEWSGEWSLPFGWKDSSEKMHESNIAGIFGSCQFLLPGIKVLIPNGRNSDGSLNNIEYTTSALKRDVYTYLATVPLVVLLTQDGTLLRVARYYESNEIPTLIAAYTCWYDTENNLMKYSADGTTWTTIKATVVITSIETAASTYTSAYYVNNMTVKNAFRAVDNNDFISVVNNVKNIVASNNLYSTTYISGTSGYREWFSDSAKTTRVLLEQWGLVTSSGTAVKLLKSYSNTNYNVCFGEYSSSSTLSGNQSGAFYNKTTAGFTIVYANIAGMYWRTCGK